MTTPRDAIAGLSERLRSPVWNDETMKGWDSWREMIVKNRGSLPRDCFESFLDGIDEERAEAAATIDALQAERDELRMQLDYVMQEFQIRNDELKAVEDRADALQARVKELERENGILRDMLLNPDPDIEPDNLRLHREKCDAIDRALVAESRALRAEQERDEAYERAAKVAESPDIWKQYEGDFEGNCIAVAIRRLAGPEKEGK